VQFHVSALISIVAGILNSEISLTFIIWPFESHIAAAAGAVFNLNTHCKTAFSLSGEKHVHLMGQQSPIFLVKGKAFLLQAWTGPEGSRKLRFPDFMTMAQDGGKVVSLTHQLPLPRKYSWYSFLLEAESTPGP